MVLPLPLITPQGSNFLKDFPGQNAVNLDLVDDYAGPCLTSHPIQSFNSTLVSSTPGSDPVLGTGGFTKGYYYQIFDQIYMWGEFRFGTAAMNVGADIYCINIPFVADTDALFTPSTVIGAAPLVGVGLTYINGTNVGRLPLTVHLRTPSQLFFGVRMNSGLTNRELRSAGYVAWNFQDGISWNARIRQVT